MDQYLKLMADVLAYGHVKVDRTGTGTRSVFGRQIRFDLQQGFPLLTTKKVHFKSIIHELIWFISGSTNIKYLVDNGVRIWDEWPHKKYQGMTGDFKMSLGNFHKKIKRDKEFAWIWGNLGPVYGKQWRDFNGVDQLANAIELIKNAPDSRRIIINAWNPSDLGKMLLPPCHMTFQFYVAGKTLSCSMYQRSCDVFLGLPFNIASYALLTEMIAKTCDLKTGELIITTGDTHIYNDHMVQATEQITREPRRLPIIEINKRSNIDDYIFGDIALKDYDPHPKIKARVSI